MTHLQFIWLRSGPCGALVPSQQSGSLFLPTYSLYSSNCWELGSSSLVLSILVCGAPVISTQRLGMTRLVFLSAEHLLSLHSVLECLVFVLVHRTLSIVSAVPGVFPFDLTSILLSL